MAQIKLLKVNSDGHPEENGAADDITLASYTVAGGGPVLSATGLDFNGQDITDLSDLVFTDPSVGTINQTTGALVVNNIMAKERSNTLTVAADILFPVITDVAGQVDAFRLPALAGAPTATPTASGEGFLVWNSTANSLYAWNGTGWDDLSTVSSAESLDNLYTAEVAVAARDVVYISSADNVSPADADGADHAEKVIGLAVAGAAAAASVSVRSQGIVTGFSGLTAGAVYFLDAVTPGAIVSSAPTGTGKRVFKVGIAKSATALHLAPQYIAKRA